MTAALLALMRRELVAPEPSNLSLVDAYKFRHILIRDAAYEAMPLAARADAHERLAGWLVGLGDMVPDASARIGTQLERAHRAASEIEHRIRERAPRIAEVIVHTEPGRRSRAAPSPGA